jgi:hypothetical protein
MTSDFEQKFDWANALIDAVITSGITFFSALGGGAVAGVSDIHIIESATIAAFSQFFVFLALKRGLVKSEEPQFQKLVPIQDTHKPENPSTN